MPINSAELRQVNVPEEQVRAFEDAVRSSQARARTEVPFWAGTKTVKSFLGLQHSDTVSVAIGPPSGRWANLIRRVYEVDPLVCPRCGAEMCVIGFITEPEPDEARILDYLRKRERVSPLPRTPSSIA